MAAIGGGARLGAVALLCVLGHVGAVMNFTMYSQPLQLRYGQVYNKMQSDGDWQDHQLPPEVVERYAAGDKAMAVRGFDLDIVRREADGRESQVKLSDHYLHHYLLYFGERTPLKLMADAAAKDPHLAHMLTSCHGMTGAGLRMFQSQMEAAGAELLGVTGEDIMRGIRGVGFGGASGAEYRHNPQRFEAPYRLVVLKPEVWFPTFHVINSKDDTRPVSPLLECPCTPQRKINATAGTVDGKQPDPPFGCSPGFEAEGNPSCGLSTYVGGWRCCEHGVFLYDTDKECKTPDCEELPVDTVYMKFNFQFEDATAETRPIEGSACCDTTSDGQGDGNIEHDVPQCPEGTPLEECVFVTESVQPVGYYGGVHHHHEKHLASDMVDLVFAAPHLHWSGLSIELIDHETNKTLCEVHRASDNLGGVMYGNGTEPGNEDGYLVGLRPCVWGGAAAAPRFRRDHLLRARSVYNASSYHMGVMSLWLMSVSAVPASEANMLV